MPESDIVLVNVQPPVGMEYIPTEEERRVFKECNQESFWYRCKFPS